MTRQTFGTRFQAARKAAGLTQSSAAKRARVAQPRIAEYENGSHAPGLFRLLQLIKILGLDPRILFPEWFR